MNTDTLSSLSAIAIPDCYLFLLEPAPRKVLYGGRNGGKDWNLIHTDLILSMLYDPAYTEEDIKAIVAFFKSNYGIKTGLIERSLRKPHRILYAREVMSSIRKSIYTVIKDRIREIGLTAKWVFRDDQINCINGSEFIFAGLYRDPHNIKSKEGITLARVIEAENVSDESWKHFIPTIRAPGSEVLVSFNTRYTDDPTYQRWVVTPPKTAIVRKVNSLDLEGYYKKQKDADGNYIKDASGNTVNELDDDGQPIEMFLTKEAKQNRADDYAMRRWEYDNVWLGEPLAAGRKIYPMFSEEIHCKHFDPKELLKKANFFMAQDPAQKYYPAVLFCALFPDEYGTMIKYIFAEYPSYDDFQDYFHKLRTTLIYNGTIKEMATALSHRGGETMGVKMTARFIDTRFAQGSGGMNMWSNSTTGIVEEYLKRENGGMSFECPDVNVIDGQRANIILDMSYNTLLPIGAANHPALYIDPGCTNLIESLKNHRLEEKSEKESARYKDFSDALRILYAGMADQKYRWIEPGLVRTKLEYRWGRRNRGSGDPDAYLAN